MRKDLLLNPETEDIYITSQPTSVCFNGKWETVGAGATEIVCTVNLSESYKFDSKVLQGDGLIISVPYKPSHLPVKLKIYNHDNTQKYGEYQLNAPLYGIKKEKIKASEMVLVSFDKYRIRLVGDALELTNGEELDFVIGPANTQNKYFMLRCVPGNNYMYPTAGVGLDRWLNSTKELSGLAETLTEQFADDKTPVKKAYFNSDKTQLIIELNTSAVD